MSQLTITVSLTPTQLGHLHKLIRGAHAGMKACREPDDTQEDKDRIARVISNTEELAEVFGVTLD